MQAGREAARRQAAVGERDELFAVAEQQGEAAVVLRVFRHRLGIGHGRGLALQEGADQQAARALALRCARLAVIGERGEAAAAGDAQPAAAGDESPTAHREAETAKAHRG